MVFSSAVFIWLFMPIVFLINLIIPKKWSNIFLLIASLIFYAWGEPIYVLLMIGTIIVNWLLGMAIDKFDNYRKLFMIVGVCLDVATLGYFKYANFFVNTFNMVFGKELIPYPNIALPIGISFFTFQAISYIVDVYRRDTKASYKFVNVALYIAYFPQLIAGPILKYKEINEQIEHRTITKSGVTIGFRRFVYGLAKKVIISNILGQACDLIFGLDINQVGFKTAWIGVTTFVFQIYYDFSGYSDMAIGLGMMFGFTIPENFDYPFMSKSITEIWRRWHMSLGSWFREYVYFPLGGSRKGENRTIINLTIMFALTGLWHGASFSYLFFGLYMAFFMVIERKGLYAHLNKWKALSHIYTIVVWHYGCAIFRVNNLPRALQWMKKMTAFWRIGEKDVAAGNYMNATTLAIYLIAILGCGILPSVVPENIKKKWQFSAYEWVYCVILFVISLSCIAGDTYNPFIYFQF